MGTHDMNETDEPRRTVLVTGGSAGLGAALVSELAAGGWTVYAASRRATLPADSPAGVQALRLDVCDRAAWEDVLNEVTARTGPLDALVCNAGVNVSAPVEELAEEQARAIVETNFWGVTHGVRAVLPGFRRQRRGVILVIGSLAGMVSPPGEAWYAASKHAVRGFLESLQYEVRGFGTRVHLVEPGFIRTDLARATPPRRETIADYDAMRRALDHHWRKAISGGMDPRAAAQRIALMLNDAGAPFRRRIGSDAHWVPRLKALLPTRVFFAAARRRFGLD